MSSQPTNGEVAHAREWFGRLFESGAEGVPFSFRYGGGASASSLKAWKCDIAKSTAGDGITTCRLSFRDPLTSLECSCDATLYGDFPAVEWVIRFANHGNRATPIISDIQALDVTIPCEGESVRLHHANGSLCQIDDFAPHETVLGRNGAHRITTTGGRSSNGALPFFNLELGQGGVIGGIGWTGNWAASFERDGKGRVRVRAGMHTTHLRLLPGETIRSPRILLLFWDGESLHGQNLLRRFILAHHTPRPGGTSLDVPLSFAVWGENRAERQIAKARWFAEHDIPIDNFWIDAGWHGDGPFREKANVFNTNWGEHVGNRWPNKGNYSEGLAPIGEVARGLGMRFTLWFEPERVFRDTYFARKHPEWLLGPIGDNFLFNLGNPEARAALTDSISSVIAEGGITVYRQDFNIDPEPFWHAADAPDRIGTTEIRHIEGLYAFWDALLERHQGLIIDNCSSGGRRIDLETISRSIPLWRSDYQCFPNFDPIGMQGQTQGLSLWVPLSTGCCDRPDTYAFRSSLLPGVVMATSVSGPDEPEGYRTPWDAYPVDWLRRMACEQQEVKKYATGDFYPLVSFSLGDDLWAAWQFDRSDLGEGAVVALRRQNSPFVRIEAPLRGLKADARYEVRSFDDGATTVHDGRDLLTKGIAVEIPEKPGSRLFVYRRLH